MMRGGGRRDAKAMSSRNRYARIDPDVLSQYEEDEGPSHTTAPRLDRAAVSHVVRTMAGGTMHGGNNRGGRGGQAGGRYQNRRDQQMRGGAAGLDKNRDMVYRIKIRNGRKFGVPWILKHISQNVDIFKPLVPTVWDSGDVIFHVRSEDESESIASCNRRIIHKPTGDRMQIQSEKVVAPWSKLKREEVVTINEVVDARYNHESRALDLSEFHLDPKFREKDMIARLSTNNIMLVVVERIDERYGHVSAVSLQGNNLRTLDYVAMLVYVTKFVKVLDMRDNQINSIEQLEKLRGMPVEVFFLERNPICESLTTASGYLSAVHSVFPKVISLDSQTVNAGPQVPDLDSDTGKELTPKGSFVPSHLSEVVTPLIQEFITQYYALYDSPTPAESRKNLMAAYEENSSTFSLVIQYLKDSERATYNDQLFGQYIRNSHNLMQEEKWCHRREERVPKGAMSIAVFLSKLPRTKHYMESFMMDVLPLTECLLSCTLQGLFADGEIKEDLPTLNFFTRHFVVSASPEGKLVIHSDMVYISGITTARASRYRALMNKANLETDKPATIAGVTDAMAGTAMVAAGAGATGAVDDGTKHEMILSFSRESGMKPEWSEKCLEDSNWNYEAAGAAFLAMREQIPKDAFA